MSSLVCNMGLVLVEFEYEYTGRDGALVSIKPNERYILLAKTNDHWWHVRKNEQARPFYIPAKYVKELPAEFPSPLDFADPPSPDLVPVPGPVPVPVPKHYVPDRAETRAGDEVTIRLRSPKRHQKTEHRMSTFGVPLEFHDPSPGALKRGGLNDSMPGLHSYVALEVPLTVPSPQANNSAKHKKQLSLSSGVLFGSSLSVEEPLSLNPRAPSFSPADPLHRPSQAIPVERPLIPDAEVTGGGIPHQEPLKEPECPLELEKGEKEKSSVEPEDESKEDSENIYESILDLKLDESPIIVEKAPTVSPAAAADPTPVIAPISPSPTQTQVENASPNTAVYANVTELKKNIPQSPPLVALSPDLPLTQEGWQVHTDKDSGKEFYYRPVTGQTTWADPRSTLPSTDMELPKEALSVPALSPALSPGLSPALSPALSPGLSMALSPGLAPAPALSPGLSPALSPALSPGLSPASSQGSNWEQVLDETTGRNYFYNPTSGATSWGAPEPIAPSSPVTEPPVLKLPNRGPPPLPKEDYLTEDHEAPDTSSSVFPKDLLPIPQAKQAIIPRAILDSVPAGWKRSMEADGKTVFTSERTQEQWLKSGDQEGKTYYYLRDGSRSQWNLPAELPVASSLPKVRNGVDQDSLPVLKNWRHTMGPAQFGPSQEDNRFFPTHRRNVSDVTSEASSSGNSPETPHHTHLLEKAGILNKTKVADNGKRIRKNWSPSWTVLHGGILTFHKDPKSAPSGNSNKTNQITPEYTVELRGATVGWAPKDKSSKKNVLELKTRHGCEYLVQYDTESIICDWHRIILDTVRQLDQDHLSEEEEEEPMEKSPLASDRDKRTSSATKITPGISAESSDQGRVRTKLRRFLQKRPTLQSVKEKGYIRDNVFGCHLDTLCHRENSTVPRFVEKCIRAVEIRGLDIDGIYRVSGNLAVIQRLRHKADHEENLDLEDGQWEEIHVITGALKLFLRELPEPLFPYSFFDKFIAAIKIQDYPQKVSYFRDLVRSLPLPNHDTMHLLFKHLLKVIEFGEKNRMSVQSVAIVFGPTLLRPQTESANITVYMVFQNQIVELILKEFETVFAPS
uniref:Rho GTPase-activating protein 27 n=1 Tax=Oncorhynchus mykiss TaxID=8022 RepID=A0A8C7WEM1_ONCMY